MKKNLIALLLAMAMVCSLAACGGNQPAEEETDAPAVEETLPEAEDVVTELPAVDPGVDTPAAPVEDPAVTPSMPTVEPEVTPEVEPEVKPEVETPSQPPVEETPSCGVDLNAFYEATFANIVKTVGEENAPFLMLAEGEMLDAWYPGLNSIASHQSYIYVAAIQTVACEFAFIEVKNPADVDAAKAILQNRIDMQVDGGAWYPETIESWKNNSRIVVNGNCIMMAVYNDVDPIVSEFNGLFA